VDRYGVGFVAKLVIKFVISCVGIFPLAGAVYFTKYSVSVAGNIIAAPSRKLNRKVFERERQ
jgi:hypothetical protein